MIHFQLIFLYGVRLRSRLKSYLWMTSLTSVM